MPAFSALVAKETLLIDVIPLRTWKTVERMVVSQLSLADTCMSALSSVLLIDMTCIAT